MFRIGGNTFYDRKNKILMKITEFKRSGIGLIAEFHGIPNGFPNQAINPGSLCTQYLYAPQIHFDLAGKPIAFIGNSSNKIGEFSLIKIDFTSICLFPYYIKDKATMDTSLIHGDDLPKELLSKTNWNDFKESIVGTLIPNFFITYFGQDLPLGDISDDEIKAKLVRLGTGYELWANTANNAVEKLDNILSVMEKIKTPESIKEHFHPN